MIQSFCFRCSRISTSAEGLRCSQCDRDEYRSVMAANLYSAIPEFENSSPGYHVPVENASTQVSEENFMQEEPTREASTQTFVEEFPPLIPTREASTQTSDDDSECPLQIDESHGYENCANADSHFQNKTADDLYQYTNEASENSEDGQDKDSIAQSSSSFSPGNQSDNKCFQENLVTANIVAQQKSESSSKWSGRFCGNCGKYFRKERTFNAHKPNYYNSKKRYECRVCGKIFLFMATMLEHERVHSGEKPFKCTQCNYATALRQNLKKQATKHTNLSPSFSSSSRRNPSGRKYFHEKLVTEEKNIQMKSRICSKLSSAQSAENAL